MRKIFLFSVFFFLFSVFCPLSFVRADQIRIRTIITPVGSQSEKWGAAGLMVCIGGEPINVGGCGINDVIGVNRKSAEGTETIDIEQQFCDTTSAEEYCNKMVFFVDDGDHQFGSGDTVYEVRGREGAGEFPEDACMWVKNECPDGWVNTYDPCLDETSRTTIGIIGNIVLKNSFSSEANALACCRANYGVYTENVESFNGCTGVVSYVFTPMGYNCSKNWVCSEAWHGYPWSYRGTTWRCKKDSITYYWCCPPE